MGIGTFLLPLSFRNPAHLLRPVLQLLQRQWGSHEAQLGGGIRKFFQNDGIVILRALELGIVNDVLPWHPLR